MVGLAREQGWGGVPIKPGAAESWYRRGAACGDFRAHYYLAVRALRRNDIDAALKHLPQAVEGAFPDFCRELARDLKDHPDARVRALAARADARVREAETAVLPPLREKPRRRRRGPMRFLRLV